MPPPSAAPAYKTGNVRFIVPAPSAQALRRGMQASSPVLSVSPNIVLARDLEFVVALNQRWRDPSEGMKETLARHEEALYFFDGDEACVGYAECLLLGGNDIHIRWFTAPGKGSPALTALIAYAAAHHPHAKSISLCVALDASDPPSCAGARLNLYMHGGGFKVESAMGMPDGSTTLHLRRPLHAHDF